MYLGEFCGARPSGQADQPDLPGTGCPGSLERRRRGAQHHRRALHLRPLEGHLPGMIPGRLLAAVTLFMLLVDHDDPEIRKRRKQRRPRADHHIQVALGRPVKLILALPGAHFRMDDGDPAAEAVIEPHHGLVGQRDLRDQDDRLPSSPDRLRDQLDIDLRLAAAGHPLYQVSSTGSFLPVGDDALHRPALFLVQFHLRMGKCLRQLRIPVDPGPLHPDESLFHQGLDDGGRDVELLRADLIGKPLLLDDGAHQSLSCRLMAPAHHIQFPLRALPGDRQDHHALLKRGRFLPGGKDGPHGGGQRRTVPVPDPDRQGREPPLFTGQAGDHRGDRLDPVRFDLRMPGQAGHISRDLPVARTEGRLHDRAFLHLPGQFFRDKILEGPVQRLRRDIHDHIRI